VRRNCKHVAALAIVAAEGGVLTGSAQRRRHRPLAGDEATAWEQSLRALIDASAAPVGERPLAIELSLRPDRHDEPRLLARLMRPGARGGWVNGQLSWGGLDSWNVREGEYRSDHLELARELHAIHRARERRPGYYYAYGESRDRTLDLSECDSPQLWSLLDEAARIGLRLVHAAPELGELAPPGQGELLIDVSRDDERGARVSAVLRLGDEGEAGLEPLAFLGAGGHGVVCARRDEGADDRLEHRRLRLVRLAKPAPRPLQRMALEGERLEIPAEELDRFASEIYPALRQIATVASSDGSFEPPEISGPELTLQAGYGAWRSAASRSRSQASRPTTATSPTR